MYFFQSNLNKWKWQGGKAFDMAPQAEQEAAGRGRGGEKHEIYAAAFGDRLFYGLFLQGRGGGSVIFWESILPSAA